METKIAVVAIIVSDKNAVEKINALLHTFGDYIIGADSIHYGSGYVVASVSYNRRAIHRYGHRWRKFD